MTTIEITPALLDQYGIEATTIINGIVVDLRSEGLFETQCLSCMETVHVEIVPTGKTIEDVVGKTRHVVHAGKCTLEFAADLAEAPVPGKHALPYDLTAEVKAMLVPTNPKPEEPILDLTKFSPAQLAHIAVNAQDGLVAERAAMMAADCQAAEEARARQAAHEEMLKQQAREAQKDRVLPGFMVRGVMVPTLDLRDVNLDEVASVLERAPYSLALVAMGKTPLTEGESTYEFLAEAHSFLRDLGETLPIVEQERTVVALDADTKAKVEVFAEIKGVSFDKAHEMLASAGII